MALKIMMIICRCHLYSFRTITSDINIRIIGMVQVVQVRGAKRTKGTLEKEMQSMIVDVPKNNRNI